MAEELDDYNDKFFEHMDSNSQEKFEELSRQIDEALYWSGTQEGHSYWSNIRYFFNKVASMDLNDENDKESLFDDYNIMTDPDLDNENYSVKEGIANIETLKDFYNGLFYYFSWRDSPQGQKFWNEVHTRVGLKIEAYDEE